MNAEFEPDVVETPILGKVEVPKAPELLASRLREQILSGAVAEGDVLPTERALGAQTGLGRSTVREALRILQNEGFISIRSGRNGGPVARRPERAFVETSLEHFIRAQRLRLEFAGRSARSYRAFGGAACSASSRASRSGQARPRPA